ncbi:MAG: hypothetical protein ACI4JK_05255 [Oscillospiraceae bacterium]
MAEYKNLIGEIAIAHLNYVDIAKELGITRDTLRNKLSGKTAFNIDEAIAIKSKFFPEKSFEQLFERTS